ncbi:NAD(P)-dependent dehydrogenase (short-subunit alcohol dehydrogenase family) [Flavobacterium sp. CG_23.5]|uniref:SDR family oxidoreductase n=1 Tax=Flavobacterium sp. CG_23.5 TaxID=2760708 RepID=UPI001AE4DC53|nr:SDR family oxidoreductase [Flavobacterium sp. CG_23.5]MBP2283035.1 NAD(P)-dependent dehydrogenase (short-subunit alcohol dehydrogenase family) [Flavobacterium sp. CG_23.5]
MAKNLFDLTGKIALITGGAGLLATEHAIALHEYGAKIIFTDVNFEICNEKAIVLKEQNIDVEVLKLDVTSKENWIEVTKQIISKFGRIDILVNNAGFTNQNKTSSFDKEFENFPLEDWNAIMNVNLTGAFLGCQIVGAEMLKQGNGSIINIASLYGVVSPNHKIYEGTEIRQPVAYSVSKNGVIALTKYVATLWAKKGVRVNSLTPGGIFNNHDGLFLERFEQLNPIGRMSQKEELRGGIVYLASDASSHVVGHNLIIDGGWTVW